MEPALEAAKVLSDEIYDLIHIRLLAAGFEDGLELHMLGSMALDMASAQMRYSLGDDGYIAHASNN